MKRHLIPEPTASRLFLLASLLLAISDCGGERDTGTSVAGTTCRAGVAVVGIGDGYFQTVCGCDEVSGRFYLSPSTLTCTAPIGTTFIFQFLATKSLHQVISLGSPSFVSSPVSDPGLSEFPVRAHAIKPNAFGMYRFRDATNSALDGILVIR